MICECSRASARIFAIASASAGPAALRLAPNASMVSTLTALRTGNRVAVVIPRHYQSAED